jgi:hypothetical protein
MIHSLHDAALTYAARGWRVFPLRPSTKRPACAHGVLDATTDPVAIRAWWQAMPAAGIGFACGAEHLVIDVDGPTGLTTLAALSGTLGLLVTGRVSVTPHGRHLYFSMPEPLGPRIKNSVGTLGSGLDIRTTGGYVILPPTPGYRWELAGLASPLPATWLARLQQTSSSDPAPPGDTVKVPPARAAPSSPAQALTDAVETVCTAPAGTRNRALNNAALTLGHLVGGGQLRARDVSRVLTDAAKTAGLEDTEIAKTLASGLTAGRAEPRKIIVMKAAGQVKPKAHDEEPWRAALAVGAHGKVKSTPANCTEICCESPTWRGALGWDEFSLRALWLRVPYPAFPGAPSVGDPFSDVHVTWAQRALQRDYGVNFGDAAIWHSLLCSAWAHKSHLIRDWMHGLTWDGTSRVGWWLSTYLGATSTEYTRTVGQCFLVSAVARIERPGIQCDHVLVLEGRQGVGKSSCVRILAGSTYLGSLPDVRDKKAAAEVLQGRWIVEIGELDALRGAAGSRVKDFLTQTTDYFRPAYARVAGEYPRQVVFLATTNEERYLSDATGARRYWPVRCAQLNRARLVADRDQLWAEALTLYRAGASWWGDEQTEAWARDEQEQRYLTDEWETPIAQWLHEKVTPDDITTGGILENILHIPIEKWERTAQTRVGSILTRLGYHVIRRSRDGARVRVYVRS